MPSGTEGPPPNGADVAVIGAGFAGLSAALFLAKRGVRVVVLEAQSIGWGASSRNGGMVLTGLKLGVEALASRYGYHTTRRMYAASLASIDLVEEIVCEESIECDFRRCGHLEVACKPSHFAAYARSVELISREFNHWLRIVGRNELSEEIGSDIYFGGLVDETSAGLQPARYVAGLAKAVLRAGAGIYENSPVEKIQRASRRAEAGFEVSYSRGRLFTREVFIASGAYTSSLVPELCKKIIPIGSFIIATKPLSETLARELSPRNRMIYDSRHFLHYFRLTPDKRMLFGGRAAFLPETPSRVRRSAEILRRGMVKVFPQLCETPVEYVWGGTLDFCFDTMPHAGCVAGLYYALGFAGHGVAMATYLGREVAKTIIEHAHEHPFREISFPNAPAGLRGRWPWLLPAAGAFYKVLDWIS
ncbi:MAG TPA: FAD-binding oxidoreductase [Tepidisphaeraceae bacterium]|nr:FAD-binding oxidoreductase [Tepidisphaeraceae bacterium]